MKTYLFVGIGGVYFDCINSIVAVVVVVLVYLTGQETFELTQDQATE